MSIFNLNVVFAMNILFKCCQSVCALAPGLPKEQDFPESNLITADQVGK
jgi:hypothetical protein